MLPGIQVKRLPRPTAGVTADRVQYAVDRWRDRFTPAEIEAADLLITRLNKIAEDTKR